MSDELCWTVNGSGRSGTYASTPSESKNEKKKAKINNRKAKRGRKWERSTESKNEKGTKKILRNCTHREFLFCFFSSRSQQIHATASYANLFLPPFFWCAHTHFPMMTATMKHSYLFSFASPSKYDKFLWYFSLFPLRLCLLGFVFLLLFHFSVNWNRSLSR